MKDLKFLSQILSIRTNSIHWIITDMRDGHRPAPKENALKALKELKETIDEVLEVIENEPKD